MHKNDIVDKIIHILKIICRKQAISRQKRVIVNNLWITFLHIFIQELFKQKIVDNFRWITPPF